MATNHQGKNQMQYQAYRKQVMSEALTTASKVFESMPFSSEEGCWDNSMTEAEQDVYDKISMELHNLKQLLRTIR
jgi:hypothetical protein